MRIAWMLQSRRLLKRLGFWLAALGYDERDRSRASQVYLFYALFIAGLAGFAILSFLAGAAATLLESLGAGTPNLAAVAIGLPVLLAWAVYQLYRAGRRSPFVFNDADAELVCLTPIDRRGVALAWLLGAWPEPALPFWAGAVTLGFALVEIAVNRHPTWNDFPRYIFAGVRALSVAVPLQLALTAAAWAAGAARLRRDRDLPALSVAAPAAAVLAGAGVLASAPAGFGLWAALAAASTQAWLAPLGLPLQAAFGLAPWGLGLGVALVLAALALAALWFVAEPLNLSRAAQETRGRAQESAASLAGASRVAREHRARERLGAGHAASPLPAGPGAWSLAWKDAVQSLRLAGPGGLWTGAVLLGLSLGLALAGDWGTRGWLALLWVLQAEDFATRRLQSDLTRWWLFRQLPVRAESLVLAEMGRPILVMSLLAWAGLGLGAVLGAGPGVAAFAAVPFAAASIALVAAFDVLRQCDSADLAAGNVPQPGTAGLVLGLLALAGATAAGLLVGPLLAVALTAALAYVLWQLAAHTFAGL